MSSAKGSAASRQETTEHSRPSAGETESKPVLRVFLRRTWRGAVSTAIILVAGVLLYFSLRGTDWALVAHTVSGIRPEYAALAVAVGIMPLLLRAFRWQILLQAQQTVAYKTSFWALAAGYFGNNFLPARGGELVRCYIVRERSTLGLSYLLATVLTEHVADAVALVLIGAVILQWAMHRSFWVVGLLGFIFLLFLPMLENPLRRVLNPWPRLQGILQQILLGVRSLHDARRLSLFVVTTSAIWWLDAISTATLAHALSLPISLSVAMLLIVALSLASALPSAPGYVGLYQFVAVTVLKPFGICTSAAIAFILVTQAFSYLVVGVFGLLALTRFTPFNWRSFRRPLQPIQTQS
jgi:uncharacterized protein (TIRG00374 family)